MICIVYQFIVRLFKKIVILISEVIDTGLVRVEIQQLVW